MTAYYIAKPSVIGFEVKMEIDKTTGRLTNVCLVEVDSGNNLSEDILSKLDPILIHNLANFCTRTDEIEKQWHTANFN